MKLNGRVAVVTGGAKGIGLAIAKRLVDEGVRVALWDLDGDGAVAAAADLAAGAIGIRADVTDEASVQAAIESTRDTLGPIDVLVNNAGVLVPGEFTDQPGDRWRFTMDVNATAVLQVTHAVLPEMLERDTGHIVNISSAAGLLGVPGLTAYAASKWAVFGFTESLRHELQNQGSSIRVSSIHPMYVASGLFEGAKLTGIGALVVPTVRDHDVVARAVVESALKRGRYMALRPRSLRLALLLRGILPYRLYLATTRLFGVHQSMNTHHQNLQAATEGEA